LQVFFVALQYFFTGRYLPNDVKVSMPRLSQSIFTEQTPILAMNTVDIDSAIESRRSVRAFTSQTVSKEHIRHLLELAARAPSGTNCQPWKVYVLTGRSRDSLVEKVCAAHDAMRTDESLAQLYAEEYDYYPTQWVSPYIDRRRENGWGLYGLLGIGKADKEKMHEQQQRNFRFFDAPIGLMFTVDRIMGRGSLLDYGAFLQNLMLAARGLGLDTCAQAAWNRFSKIVLPHIGASEQEMLVCGMALGYADTQAVVNTFHTPRVDVDGFTVWRDGHD
jgi:nitroreductase